MTVLAKWTGRPLIELTATELDQMLEDCRSEFKALPPADQQEMRVTTEFIFNAIREEINRRVVPYQGHA